MKLLKGSFFVLCLVVTAAANAAQVYGLSNPFDPTESVAIKDVSADGKYAVGYAYDSTGSHAVRWSVSGGWQDLGEPTGAGTYHNAYVTGTNSDGSVVVGYGRAGDTYSAFIWSQSGGVSQPALVSYSVMAVSGDGTKTVVQGANNRSYLTGVTSGSSYTDMGVLPGAYWTAVNDLSDDGTKAVGECFYQPLNDQPFYWTAAGGIKQVPTPSGYTGGTADRISRDGNYITCSLNGGNGDPLYVWSQAGGGHVLDQSLDTTRSYVTDVTNSGRIFGIHQPGRDYTAVTWDSATGVERDLAEWLSTDYGLGAQLAGWSLNQVWAESADGNILVGDGTYNGVSREFYIDLRAVPEPGSVAILGLGLVGLIIRKKRA